MRVIVKLLGLKKSSGGARRAVMFLSRLAVLSLFFYRVMGSSSDEVNFFPGFGPVPVTTYSGYVNITGGAFHYLLFESESDPGADPLVLWMNGGPGCSSLKGGFEELGPLVFNRFSFEDNNGTALDIPRPFRNKLSWTTQANLLMFESPMGTGFSYCDACVGIEGCNCHTNDTDTAVQNYEAVASFLDKFPAFQGRDLYITGESYAGIYIPMLMDQIRSRGLQANLVGAAIGNGAGTGQDRKPFLADLYFGHGLFSAKLYRNMTQTCNAQGWDSSACGNLTALMNDQVGNHNFYHLSDFCASLDPSTGKGLGVGYRWKDFEAALETKEDGTLPRMDDLLHGAQASSQRRGLPRDGAKETGKVLRDVSESFGPLGEVQQWCYTDSAMNTWLDVPEVITALHMDEPKGTETNNLAYSGPMSNLTDLYASLALDFRLWIYNGMEDGCIPHNMIEDFVQRMGFPELTAWHPFYGSDSAGGSRVAAGYATAYGGDAKDLQFITIKDAGHEVPTFKPDISLALLTAFLNGQPL